MIFDLFLFADLYGKRMLKAESYGKKMLNAALNKAKTEESMYYIGPTSILMIVFVTILFGRIK